MNGLYEILTSRIWMLSPDWLQGMRSVIEGNLNGHIALADDDKMEAYCVSAATGDVVDISARSSYQGTPGKTDNTRPSEGKYVQVIPINGPVTRGGGACSYGSIDHRDMIMALADDPDCLGHIFVINTPGGSAWAKNDYQQAIDYAHGKGQVVLAFIDGLCASAGMYLASLCDERYYMHPNDEIGCIGVMAAFYTTKSGSRNQYSNETYHEIYDPESFEKNKEIRDIAQKGDYKDMLEDLARLGKEFRETVSAACPNATDEHLHGRIFRASEVEGILMDGQRDLHGTIARAAELYDERHRTTNPASGASAAGTNPQYLNMSEYPLLNKALGLDETAQLVVSEEGTHLACSLLDNVEQHLATQETALTEANAKVEDLEKAVANATEEHTAAMDVLNAEHEAALNTIKEEHAAAIEALNSEHTAAVETLNSEHATALETVNADLEAARQALAEAEQKIADREATIKRLSSAPGAEPNMGEGPKTNGYAAPARTMTTSAVGYDSNLTPAQNAERQRQRDAELQRKIASKTAL